MSDEEHHGRGRVLAERLGQRIVATGKAHNPTGSDPYLPLMVRQRDAGETVRMLTVAPEIVGDLGRLLDAVLVQGRILAAQARTIEVLKSEVDQLRRERVVTIVTKQMNDDLLKAAERGVELRNYECTIELSTRFSTKSVDAEKTALQGREQDEGVASAEVEFANLFDLLKGAKFHGDKSTKALATLEAAATRRVTSNTEHSEDTKASIRFEHLGHGAYGGSSQPEPNKR